MIFSLTAATKNTKSRRNAITGKNRANDTRTGDEGTTTGTARSGTPTTATTRKTNTANTHEMAADITRMRDEIDKNAINRPLFPLNRPRELFSFFRFKYFFDNQ